MKGFTLIEVLLTTSLVTVVAILSVPFYSQFILSQETSVVIDELEGSLRKAQFYSMAQKNDATWGVTSANSRIVLFRGDSYTGRDQAFDETYDIQSNVTVSGLGEVVFTQITGRPSATPTIVVSGNGTTETFVLNGEGVLEKQ